VAESGGPKVLLAVEQLRRSVPGGIGSYARGLLSGLDECASHGEGEGTEITLLASRNPHSGADPLEHFGRRVIASPLPAPLLTRAWDRGWLRAPSGFDVVHSVSLAAPRLSRAGGGRAVVTVHDVAWRRHPEATTARGRKWHEAALRRVQDSDAALIVPSKFVAADLTDDGVDADRISIVYGGSDHLVPADMVLTAELLGRLGVQDGFLLTVSTLEPRKNVDRLLAAYRQLRGSLPEPWPLVIVGPTGWGPALRDQEDTEGVVFAGSVSEAVLTGLYRSARAFAYVPLTEGYGLPPLEAMRVGVPTVVANQVPSVRDLDQPGPSAARIVDPFDVDSIAAGLAAVLMDETVRADLATRGEAYSRTRTWRAAAKSHIGLWRSL
jgi:glycosyltransferase involved in cell wall biosynthesis